MAKDSSLIQDNIYLLMGKFLLSSILGTLTVSLYILFDTIFIGQGVGSEGLAALNICLPVYNLFSATGLLIGMGGGASFSLALGQNKESSASLIFSYAITLGISLSLIFTLMGFIFLEPLALELGATPDILFLVKDYMRLLFLFAPSFILVHILTVFVRNNNFPQVSMIATITSGVVNILLDILFIFPLGMGMKGAALATGLSSVVALCILTFTVFKVPGHLKFTKLITPLESILQIISLGFPSFILEMCSGLVIFLFNLVLLKQVGTIGVSAYGIIANIALIAVSVFNGIGQGLQPLISINYSANQTFRLSILKRSGLFISFIVGVLFYIVGYLYRFEIASLFITHDPELLELAASAIPYYFIAFLFTGINLVYNYTYQSMGAPIFSTFISLGRGLFFIIIGLLFLPSLLGIVGVWLVVPFAEISTLLFIIVTLCYKKIRS